MIRMSEGKHYSSGNMTKRVILKCEKASGTDAHPRAQLMPCKAGKKMTQPGSIRRRSTGIGVPPTSAVRSKCSYRNIACGRANVDTGTLLAREQVS